MTAVTYSCFVFRIAISMMLSLVILVPWSQSKCFCFDIFCFADSWPWVSVVTTRGTSRNGKNACTEVWFKELSHCHAAAYNSFWNKVREGLMEGWKEGMMVWCSCPLRCMAWGGMRLLTVCGEASPLKLNLWSLNYRCVFTSSYFVLCISQIFHL